MSRSTEELLRELDATRIQEGSTAVAPRTRGRSVPVVGRVTEMGSFLVILAVILVALIGSLPFGSLALYPFALFVTLLHETGHALAAIATGGAVDQLRISSDLSGVTGIGGGVEALIAPAGYLGATLAGIGLLLTPRRYARMALAVLAAVPVLALVLFHPATFFTAAWCVVFALCLGLAAWKLPLRFVAFLQIFLGVEAGLNAFRDLMTLWLLSSSSAHIRTDADLMSSATFLPSMFWAVAWTLTSLVLLVAALLLLVRRDIRQLRG